MTKHNSKNKECEASRCDHLALHNCTCTPFTCEQGVDDVIKPVEEKVEVRTHYNRESGNVEHVYANGIEVPFVQNGCGVSFFPTANKPVEEMEKNYWNGKIHSPISEMAILKFLDANEYEYQNANIKTKQFTHVRNDDLLDLFRTLLSIADQQGYERGRGEVMAIIDENLSQVNAFRTDGMVSQDMKSFALISLKDCREAIIRVGGNK